MALVVRSERRLSPLPGGFVGVDIFFVISGFLISTILVREMETGTYRYSTFMARRIRRIFSALCTVLTATFIAGWLLLSQQELVPLLHLWSLGVEEQYHRF